MRREKISPSVYRAGAPNQRRMSALVVWPEEEETIEAELPAQDIGLGGLAGHDLRDAILRDLVTVVDGDADAAGGAERTDRDERGDNEVAHRSSPA